MSGDGDKYDRDDGGRFVKGNCGGPGGARRRPSELRRAAEDAITPEHIAAMIRKAARMGLEGNLSAMRFVMERTCGRATEAPKVSEPLAVDLPALNTAADCNSAIGALISAVCAGGTDRDLAKLLIDAIQTRLKAIEMNEFEQRLAQLEADNQHVRGKR